MEVWLMYALMAAIFISIRDIISLDFIKRYDYIQYMVIANIIIFIGTMLYVFATDFKIQKPKLNDFIVILMRILIVYLIIDPSIYNSIKNCENPGYAKSIISLNTLFVFFVATIIYKSKVDTKKIAGIIMMLAGSYFLV
jgi:drug/metabolite transporter (DMT)-like permease